MFRDITLRNIRVMGGGKVTFDGFDDAHRLAMKLENVFYDDPAAIKTTLKFADLATLADKAPPNSCTGKFVPYPEP